MDYNCHFIHYKYITYILGEKDGLKFPNMNKNWRVNKRQRMIYFQITMPRGGGYPRRAAFPFFNLF